MNGMMRMRSLDWVFGLYTSGSIIFIFYLGSEWGLVIQYVLTERSMLKSARCAPCRDYRAKGKGLLFAAAGGSS